MPPRQSQRQIVEQNLPGAAARKVAVSTGVGTSSDASRPFEYDSAADFDASGIPSGPPPTVPPEETFSEPHASRILDEEIKKPPRFEEKAPLKDSDKPKAGPPTLDEWQDFFARVVFLTIAEWYVSWAFRGIPEDIITDEDLAKCTLTREERKAIALPLSELANKSTVARKHGRQVIAFFESAEAFILIGMWMSKVHRIAGKYRPKKVKSHERMAENASPGNGTGPGRPAFDPNVQVWNPGTG